MTALARVFPRRLVPRSGEVCEWYLVDDEAVDFQLRGYAVSRLRGFSWAFGLALLQLLLTAAAISSDRLGEHPLILMMLPLAVAAVGFGLRGALSAGLLASILTMVWWLDTGSPGGVFWLAARMVIYLVVALVLGWVVDSRARLLRKFEHHNEHSLDLLATASFDGFFRQVNPAFTRALGFSREELLERPLLEFVHPDDRESTLAAVAEQTERGCGVFEFRNRYLTNDGSYRWLEWTSCPDKRAKELIAVARDVTERIGLEELEAEHTRVLETAVRERTQELEARTVDLEEARLETLQRLALAAEYRDDQTRHHTQRVGHLAAEIARQLRLGQATIELIRCAAPLHDVGKLAVSDSVLLKPGRLTTEEYLLMQEHTTAGAKLLSGSQSDVLKLGEQIALSHHERWDGSGYPHKLCGEAIPLSGRITAVADVFDALTHERPYKIAWPIQKAVAEINRLSSRQFDPRVVEAFNALDHASLLQPLARQFALVA